MPRPRYVGAAPWSRRSVIGLGRKHREGCLARSELGMRTHDTFVVSGAARGGGRHLVSGGIGEAEESGPNCEAAEGALEKGEGACLTATAVAPEGLPVAVRLRCVEADVAKAEHVQSQRCGYWRHHHADP